MLPMHNPLTLSTPKRTKTVLLESADHVSMKCINTDSEYSAAPDDIVHGILIKWFQLSNETKITAWPGVAALVRHIELSFGLLQRDDAFAPIWQAIDDPQKEQQRQQQPRDVIETWHLFSRILDITYGFRHDLEDFHIDDILNKLREGISDVDRPSCRQALFAILCWMTMTLRPNVQSSKDPEQKSSLLQDHSVVKMSCLGRPVMKIFKEIHGALPRNRWQQPVGQPVIDVAKTLHVASLNYYCLSTIGSITIVWVDNICDHLDFDSKHRRLSLFKFPTFCALSTLGETPPVISGLLRNLYNDNGDDTTVIIQAHQEILMSYRVLFGKSRSSRKLAVKELQKLKQQDKKQFDDLLVLLCTKTRRLVNKKLSVSSWPVTCLDDEDRLLEDSTYSARDDFPLFGQRLVKLQEFNDRQSASGWKDLWRDKRDPEKYWTFWAVLIIGGAAIVLGVFQLVIGILQLVVAWKQLNLTPGGYMK